MKYTIRRFSYQESLEDGKEYILAQVDSGLGNIDDLTTKIIEDPKLKDLRPVKRHVSLVKNISTLLRRKKKKKQKNNSQTDPTTSINTGEAKKFEMAMSRLTKSVGNGNNSDLTE